jgi:hypothetical protein
MLHFVDNILKRTLHIKLSQIPVMLYIYILYVMQMDMAESIGIHVLFLKIIHFHILYIS